MSADDEMVQVPRREWEAMHGTNRRPSRVRTPAAPRWPSPASGRWAGLTGRRGVLKHGAMLMAGAVVGASALVVAEAGPAEATTGTTKFGATNNAAGPAPQLWFRTLTGSRHLEAVQLA